MVFSEGFNAVYYGISAAANATRKVGLDVLKSVGVVQSEAKPMKLPPDLENLQVSRLVYSGGPIIGIAAFSGAMAVVLGAYGAHALASKKDYKESEEIYYTANRYHFYHTLALLGAPLCRFPKTAAAFMSLGMVLFCGTCYYQAFTGEKTLRKLTPVGGTCFIIGWICMLI